MKWARFPIADELIGVWDVFYWQHWNSKRAPQIVADVVRLERFEALTCLVIEG